MPKKAIMETKPKDSYQFLEACHSKGQWSLCPSHINVYMLHFSVLQE